VINRGVHEPLEEYVFQELMDILPDSPTMLELGAYWGHYSMWLKKMRPRSSVFLVEPSEENMLAGKYNFEQNHYTGEFIQAFVGQGQFEVDEFLRGKGLSHLDILHSDIQGYEVEMLDGSSNTLSNKLADYIFVSTHSQELHDTVIEKLGHYEYRVEVASNFDAETTSYDGFVFASSPRVHALFDDFKPFSRIKILNSQPQELVNDLNGMIKSARKQSDRTA
jgi:hypothetical protein